MNPFSYKLLSASELELHITGVIGDGWDDNPVTAKAVRKALGEAKNAKRIVCNVDSSGGSFFDGLAIYQMLQEHPATVDMVIGARAASAASLIAMAGDTITMHETSTMLVHPVWTVAIGNAAELRKAAEDLDLLTEASVKAYAARTGMDADEVRSLVAEDRYMSADEALKLGFCTEVREAKKKTSSMSEAEVRSEIEAMRDRATASAAAGRIAAMAPTEIKPGPVASESSTNSTPAQPVETEKKKHMAQLAVILAALCLTEGATDAEALSAINKLKASGDSSNKLLGAIGAKSADEAIGVIEALKANKESSDIDGFHRVLGAIGAKDADEAVGMVEALKGLKSQLADARSELEALNSQRQQTERDELIDQLRAEGKCTPAQEKELFPTFSLASLKAFAATAVPVLKGDGRREPVALGGYNGKSYSSLTPAEKHQLKQQDPDLFDLMRKEAERKGEI